MKFYEISIKPLSGFGTPLKGDTLFGHFCWQANYDPALLDGGLEKQIEQYRETPFAVFSSAFPKISVGPKPYYALKRPEIPPSMLFPSGSSRLEKLKQAKENKKKKWMLVEKNTCIDPAQVDFITEKQLCAKFFTQTPDALIKTSSQQHNTINRMTGATGEGQFAPYSKENTYYFPGTVLAIFVLVNEETTDIKRIVKGLERIGSWGFGRDASTGLGRFAVAGHEELILNTDNPAFYSLAPSVPDMDIFKKVYSNTFTRFGKHGDTLACSKNPFKNPVIMADEASVFILKDKRLENPYIGSAVSGVSKAMPETVVQGYTPCLPIKLEQSI
ncbi:MAG: type III-A CRISPR-associated RAMP protein Csm4 [Dissulfuribacterales bacterium]